MPSKGRVARGENRFYCPPALRKQQQQLMDVEIPNLVTVQTEKSEVSDEYGTLYPVSGKVDSDLSNLDHFLESTTPTVPAQYLPKVIGRWNEFCVIIES